MEPDEGLEKLVDALKVCNLYKQTYFDKKSQLSQYFKDTPVVEWDFKPSLVFARLDRFIGHLKQVAVSKQKIVDSKHTVSTCYCGNVYVAYVLVLLSVGLPSNCDLLSETGKD